MTPELRTERLEFLPYRPEHEDVFVELLRDEEVCRWMGQDLVPEPQIREVFRAILDDIYPQGRFDVWGLWLAGRYVGHAEVKPTGNVEGHELVTALAPGYWGQGLGGEAVRGLLRHAAEHLGLSEAYGMVGAGNTASLAMCRRLGFRHLRDVVGDDGAVTKLLIIPTALGWGDAGERTAAESPTGALGAAGSGGAAGGEALTGVTGGAGLVGAAGGEDLTGMTGGAGLVGAARGEDLTGATRGGDLTGVTRGGEGLAGTVSGERLAGATSGDGLAGAASAGEAG